MILVRWILANEIKWDNSIRENLYSPCNPRSVL